MRINIDRLRKSIEDLGLIGYIEGRGVTREAFTEAYYEGEDFVLGLMQEAGLSVRKDGLGNIYGRLEGKTGAPTILVGSHIDTVPEGGEFDGTYGVLSGIECLRTIKEEGIIPTYPLEVVAFNAEEGGPLGGTFGSRGLVGRVDLDHPLIQESMWEVALNIEDVKASKLNVEDIKCYLEMHIEQGGTLEELDTPIGIVTGIVHIERYKVIVKGQANHAGTTAMKMRDDALVKASRFVERIYQLSLAKGEGFVGTVGKLGVIPGAMNVIPGEVQFYIEFRSLQDDLLQEAEAEVRAFAEVLGKTMVEVHTKKRGVMLDEGIQKQIEDSCKKLDYQYKYMPSGAGHDAATLGEFVPTAMIFIPSVGGISHNKDEFSRWEDVEKGANVLLHTLLNLQK